MEFLVDLAGGSVKIGTRNIAAAVSQLGFIHIHAIGPTTIVTLQPRLVHSLTIAAAAYRIGDLAPERTIVVAGPERRDCWVFNGYMAALHKMASLAEAAQGSDTDHSKPRKEYLL